MAPVTPTEALRIVGDGERSDATRPDVLAHQLLIELLATARAAEVASKRTPKVKIAMSIPNAIRKPVRASYMLLSNKA